MSYIKKIKIDDSIYNIYDSEALHDASAFDEAGAAKSVLGSETDETTDNTVYGVRAYVNAIAENKSQVQIITWEADD